VRRDDTSHVSRDKRDFAAQLLVASGIVVRLTPNSVDDCPIERGPQYRTSCRRFELVGVVNRFVDSAMNGCQKAILYGANSVRTCILELTEWNSSTVA
jgi:hypothetical protein